MAGAFDQGADSYDQWYDSPEGRLVFEAELTCLRLLCRQRRGRWLEVGVGTGRFADALGVPEGIDSSRRVLELAARRGIGTYEGSGSSNSPLTWGWIETNSTSVLILISTSA